MTSYLDLMQGPVGPLSRGVGDEAKVPDGLRYHMLDIWVEELRLVLKDGEDETGEILMAPIRTLEKDGKTKTVRKRAKAALVEWESRNANPSSETDVEVTHIAEDDDVEWNGFADWTFPMIQNIYKYVFLQIHPFPDSATHVIQPPPTFPSRPHLRTYVRVRNTKVAPKAFLNKKRSKKSSLVIKITCAADPKSPQKVAG